MADEQAPQLWVSAPPTAHSLWLQLPFGWHAAVRSLNCLLTCAKQTLQKSSKASRMKQLN